MILNIYLASLIFLKYLLVSRGASCQDATPTGFCGKNLPWVSSNLVSLTLRVLSWTGALRKSFCGRQFLGRVKLGGGLNYSSSVRIPYENLCNRRGDSLLVFGYFEISYR